MDYDENKKIQVEISENRFVEMLESDDIDVKKKKSFSLKWLKKFELDALDIAIIPVTVGVFLSLGFLFASLIKVSAIADVISTLSSSFMNLI